MNNNLFKCAQCKEEFPRKRTDEEARKEASFLFSQEPAEIMVCENCFIKIMDYNEPGLKRYAPFIDKENMDG
jgi:DNA-directed RNA polymerase subunit RPC12/RpoP